MTLKSEVKDCWWMGNISTTGDAMSFIASKEGFAISPEDGACGLFQWPIAMSVERFRRKCFSTRKPPVPIQTLQGARPIKLRDRHGVHRPARRDRRGLHSRNEMEKRAIERVEQRLVKRV